MENFYKVNNYSWLKKPNDVVGVLINPVTGKIPDKNDTHKKVVYYLKGTEPSIDNNINNMEALNGE